MKPCLAHPAVICDEGCEGDDCALDELVNAELAALSARPRPDVIFLCGRRDVRLRWQQKDARREL